LNTHRVTFFTKKMDKANNAVCGLGGVHQLSL